MSDKIKNIIQNTVLSMLDKSMSDANIKKLRKKHVQKVHFIPIRYRIIGGVLQGLNIKFGNFIETLVGNIVEIDPQVKLLPDSGKKITLFFTQETDTLIDGYITNRQLPDSPDDCTELFDNLLDQIIEIEKAANSNQRQGITKDIDGLFETQDGRVIYTELKYNDDHDTGKFSDINRKFLKTWAGLAVRLKIDKAEELFPIIYYFNPHKRYGPIHTPSRNIMRGSQLFEKYFETSYEDVDGYLSEIGDDPEILSLFDDMYKNIRFD